MTKALEVFVVVAVLFAVIVAVTGLARILHGDLWGLLLIGGSVTVVFLLGLLAWARSL